MPNFRLFFARQKTDNSRGDSQEGLDGGRAEEDRRRRQPLSNPLFPVFIFGKVNYIAHVGKLHIGKCEL